MIKTIYVCDHCGKETERVEEMTEVRFGKILCRDCIEPYKQIEQRQKVEIENFLNFIKK